MIEGFEDITYELTEFERTKLVPILVAGLNKMTGKLSAFTNKQCCDKINQVLSERSKTDSSYGDYQVTDPRFRKLIHYIRVNNLVPGLIGTSRGYYKATNKTELEAYRTSLIERKNSIEDIIKSIEKDLAMFMHPEAELFQTQIKTSNL